MKRVRDDNSRIKCGNAGDHVQESLIPSSPEHGSVQVSGASN